MESPPSRKRSHDRFIEWFDVWERRVLRIALFLLLIAGLTRLVWSEVAH